MEQEKLVIQCKRHDKKGLRDWWLRIDEAFQEGWRFTGEGTLREAPTFNPMPRVVLHKVQEQEDDVVRFIPRFLGTAETESDEEEKTEEKEQESTSLVEELKTRRTLEEVIDFCKEHDIEYPEDMRSPNKIKGFIKPEVEERDNQET